MRAIMWSVALGFAWPLAGHGDFYRFDAAAKWAAWELPTGLVQVDESGRINLVKFRKDIDPVRDAHLFEHETLTREKVAGGIWRAGSNAATAFRLIDGDVQTYWQPDPADPLAKWEVEIDLGRAVLARQIRLHFPDRDGARPLRQFTVYVATGATINTRADIFRFDSVYQTTLPNMATELLIDLAGRKDTARVLDVGLGQDDERAAGFRTVQYIRIGVDEASADAALAEVEVDAVGDNITLGLLSRGGSINTGLVVRDAQGMVDGNMNTYANKFTTYQATSGWKNEGLWWEMDLGGQFWLDELFAYFTDPGEGASGSSVRNAGTGFSFLYSDGRRTTSGEVDYTRLVVEGSQSGDAYLAERHFRYLFSPRKVRYLFWHGYLTGAEWFARLPELMLFSSGYPAQVVLRSNFIDLGQIVGDGRPKAIRALHWDAELAPNTRLQLRSRSGSALIEEYTFYDKIGAEITETRYNSLPAVLKGVIDTALVTGADWSNWSNVYQFAGESFKSESPRRFVQLEAILSTEDPQVAPVLNSLAIEFDNALVQQVRGRIRPRQARPNEATRFTYTLWSQVVDADRGFDIVRIASPAGLVDVEQVELSIGGAAASGQVEIMGDSLLVYLPNSVRSDSLELSFTSKVLRNAAVFKAELGNRELPGLWQSVEASERRGDVVFLPELVGREELIGDLELSSSVLTPNGDGINDELELRFVIYKIDVLRPRVDICDLSGRPLAQMKALGTGERAFYRWDGRDFSGEMVPPGIYVLYVDLGAATGDGVALHTAAVVY